MQSGQIPGSLLDILALGAPLIATAMLIAILARFSLRAMGEEAPSLDARRTDRSIGILAGAAGLMILAAPLLQRISATNAPGVIWVFAAVFAAFAALIAGGRLRGANRRLLPLRCLAYLLAAALVGALFYVILTPWLIMSAGTWGVLLTILSGAGFALAFHYLARLLTAGLVRSASGAGASADSSVSVNEGDIICPDDEDNFDESVGSALGDGAGRRDGEGLAFAAGDEAQAFSLDATALLSAGAGGWLAREHVGYGSTNNPEDVMRVYERMRQLGFTWIGLDANGRPDDNFVLAIQMFQNIIAGKSNNFTVRAGWRDGVITPGGRTDRWLSRANAPRWVRLDDGGRDAGFVFNPSPQNSTPKPVNYDLGRDEDPDERWGTDWLVNMIRTAGRRYVEMLGGDADRRPAINVHELSYRRGGQSGHGSHYNGIDVDIRLPRLSRGGWKDVGTNTGEDIVKTEGGGWRWIERRDAASAQYDRETTEAIVRAFDIPGVKFIWLCDPVLCNTPAQTRPTLCTPFAGHHNHIHIRVRPPLEGLSVY